MLRSLYSAVSGVKSHQTYLDVTGNNIANVNTTGFKRDVLQFRDMIYQDSKSASAPNNGIPIGGVNPAQVGLGVQVGSIETVHTGGSMQSTGVPTDMAISGSGYFVVQNGTQTLYTRAGNFALDRDGNLVMQGNGYLVQGYAYRDQVNPATGETERVKDTALSAINLPIGEKIPARATTLAAFRCNLCSTATKEISDLNNVPGSTDKVLRPHQYTAYGAKSATYVGTQADVANPAVGETLYDPATGFLWSCTTTGVWGSSTLVTDTEAMYYGKNTDTTAYPTIFESQDGNYSGIVATRVMVDFVGADDPATTGITPTGAGQLYLDYTNGVLYKSNSTGTAWVQEDSVQNNGTSMTSAVYAAKASAGADAGKLYAWEGSGSTTGFTFADPGSTFVIDKSTGTAQLFSWDAATTSWTAVNSTLGLFPTGDVDANGNPLTVTNQATIDAFGESMIASRDHEVKMTVYDSLGNPYTMITAFRKVVERPADPNATPPTSAEAEWDWYSYYVASDGSLLEQYGEGAGTLVFGDDGLLKRTYYYEPTPATPDPNGTATTQPEYNWTIVEKVIGDPAYDNVSTGKVVADFNVAGAEGSVDNSTTPASYASNMITLDFLGKEYAELMGLENEPIDGVTQYGSKTTTKGFYQDGYEMGTLEDWSTGQDGTITGSYSNGISLPIAQVALAMFANPGGLSKVGNTCFAATVNSGMAQIGEPMVSGAGSIAGSTQEMSNVDLSEEFVNLIRAQRGFQANSRVVTTSDQVLEELINLKR